MIQVHDERTVWNRERRCVLVEQAHRGTQRARGLNALDIAGCDRVESRGQLDSDDLSVTTQCCKQNHATLSATNIDKRRVRVQRIRPCEPVEHRRQIVIHRRQIHRRVGAAFRGQSGIGRGHSDGRVRAELVVKATVMIPCIRVEREPNRVSQDLREPDRAD